MNYGQLVALAQQAAGGQPMLLPVGDVINKSGTFAAMQDANEIARKLDILRAQRGSTGYQTPSSATIIPLVPRPSTK